MEFTMASLSWEKNPKIPVWNTPLLVLKRQPRCMASASVYGISLIWGNPSLTEVPDIYYSVYKETWLELVMTALEKVETTPMEIRSTPNWMESL